MDNSTRLQYLQEMGIDVWIPRESLRCKSELSDDKGTLDNEAGLSGSSSVLAPNESTSNLVTNEVGEWEKLQREVADCKLCSLCESRTQTVFGTGNKQADWMFIGEAPGQSEDREGKPFVGRAGQLLTEMIRAMGLARDDVFIANILKCRPPNNRDPKPEEVEACSGYLQRQIALVRPKMILAVGRIAAQRLLKTDAPLGKLRGAVHYSDKIPVVVIYHPAYLLRSLLEKRKAWGDLQFALSFFRDQEGRFGN